ncbi:MAG: AraC family transcriptional regulator [Myxococcota bacterium]
MDVLSQVLQTVRLSGSVFFTAEMTEPWSVVSPPGELLAEALVPGARWFVLFHVVARGGCTIRLEDGRLTRLDEGDVAIFPHAEPHVMGDGSDGGPSPVPVISLVDGEARELPFRVHHGGGGAPTELVCGYLGGDERFDPLVRALPTALCMHNRDGEVTVESWGPAPAEDRPLLRFGRDSPTGTWLDSSLRYMMQEARASRAGGSSMLCRLAEALFVQVLRSFVEQLALREGGLPAGLRDPQLGRAIALMHEDPTHAWTVDELARRVGLSRSALGERFAHVLGEPPMRYLTRWRMHLACGYLRNPGAGLADVAARVGYASEAAFHRAFKRHVGESPGAWRKHLVAIPAAEGDGSGPGPRS